MSKEVSKGVSQVCIRDLNNEASHGHDISRSPCQVFKALILHKPRFRSCLPSSSYKYRQRYGLWFLKLTTRIK
ncbi:hypothetical protein FF1_016239 [Malus domestica]